MKISSLLLLAVSSVSTLGITAEPASKTTAAAPSGETGICFSLQE